MNFLELYSELLDRLSRFRFATIVTAGLQPLYFQQVRCFERSIAAAGHLVYYRANFAAVNNLAHSCEASTRAHLASPHTLRFGARKDAETTTSCICLVPFSTHAT